MNIIKRYKSPTPKGFKKLAWIGAILAAVGGAIMTFDMDLPTQVVDMGKYLTLIGTIIAAICGATVDKDKIKD